MENIKTHFKYTKYGADLNTGEIYDIETGEKYTNTRLLNGYIFTSFNGMPVHRFIWECGNGPIDKKVEIDHIDSDKLNNKLSNLQCVSISDKRKKAYKLRKDNFASKAHKLRREIKAINVDSDDFYTFSSKSQCAKHFKISPALVYLVCEQKNNNKSANTYLGKFKFEYTEDKENRIKIPDGRIGKKYPRNPPSNNKDNTDDQVNIKAPC